MKVNMKVQLALSEFTAKLKNKAYCDDPHCDDLFKKTKQG